MRRTFVLIGYLAAGSCLGAPFQNLDFNSPNLPDEPFPGWYSDNSYVWTSVCLGASCISLTGTEEDYGAFLQGGYPEVLDPPGFHEVGARLIQTGDIPIGSRSIRLISAPPEVYATSYENLRVSVSGTDIPLTLVKEGENWVTIAGSVGAFAGTTVELVISTATPPDENGDEIWARIYDVSFSPVAIPEPTTLTLIAAACCGVGWRRS